MGRLSAPTTLDANGEIALQNADSYNLIVDNYYEIIGLVQKDLSVSILQAFDLGHDFNMKAATKLVEIVHKFPEIYHDV